MKIKAELNGKEQEFEVLGQDTHEPFTHWFDSHSTIRGAREEGYHLLNLRLIRPRHTFGGVVFEETGEYRQLVEGDWFTEKGHFPFYATPTVLGNVPHTILRPVEIEASE